MDEIFNILSSSARINKSKRQKRKREEIPVLESPPGQQEHDEEDEGDDDDSTEDIVKSRDRTGKRDISEAKRKQIHREEVAAFRRSMRIRVAHADDSPDPISTFSELACPEWWSDSSFTGVQRVILRNIEEGKWKEPTPIQMQSIPALLQRRDLLGAAPTGSGKSGAFILPSLFLSSVPHHLFYNTKGVKKNAGKGEIRCLILAPSLELASQLHRQVERLGLGKPGGLSSLLLAKANAAQAISGQVGGQSGLDVLVSTPLRIVDAIEKGLKLASVRIVVLDEADRLLDASDSGSDKSRTFLSQIDTILSEIPATATRALFSATVTPTVRTLSETILRNPVDVSIGGAAANTDIDQKLMFVGNEQGKLLAIRQLVQRGEFDFPALIFCQSQERAQALFAELLYDGIRVDVIHAGRSKSARENAVAKFRKGDTWVLIGTDLVARGVDLSAVKLVLNYDLPQSGVTYVHRIGRTGRAGRKGKAITLFTEADLEQLRTIANIMKQSGCQVEEWMLQLPRKHNKKKQPPKRAKIDTTPSYDKKKKRMKKLYIKNSKEKKEKGIKDDCS